MSRQKIKNEIVDFNRTIDLIDQSKTFCPTDKVYIFLKHTQTFSRICHRLGDKTSPNKLKRLEIIPSSFPNFNGIKKSIIKWIWEISQMYKKLNNTLLNKQRTEEDLEWKLGISCGKLNEKITYQNLRDTKPEWTNNK